MARYLTAAFAGRLADSMWLAPVLLVLARTGSATQAGLVLSAATLPTLVTAPLVGAWLDRHPRRREAIAAHLAVLALSLAAMLAGAPAVVCVGVAGLLQPLVTGGFSSLVSVIATGPRSAALDAMTYNVASVAGPALAGLIAAPAGPRAAVGAQAMIALAGVPLALSLPAAGRHAPGGLREGIAHLARHPQLRAVTLVSSFSQVGWGLMSVVAPALAVTLGARAAAGGVILAAVAVGALAGAALSPRGTLTYVVGGTLAQGAGLIVLAATPTLPVALAAAALTGIPQGLATAALFSARARWSPAHLRGQVFTSAAGLRTGLYALGAALAGPALSAGPRPATALAAAACALSAAGASGSRPPAGRSGG